MEESHWHKLAYLNGFGNHFETEAEPGALVKGRNNPQKAPMGLYAEQLSGTPFTYAKHKNKRSWLYRIMPTCNHGAWTDVSDKYPQWISNFEEGIVTPEQRRWSPQDYLEGNFAEGVRSMMGAGSPSMKNGLSIHYYSCK